MESEIDLLKNILKKEISSGIYKEKLFDFSIWRIFRFKSRSKSLNIRTGFVFKTSRNRIDIFLILKNTFKSFLGFFKFLFFEKDIVDNVIFAFPRLQKVDQYYFDKFTDPVIEYSSIKDSFIVFQRHFSGEHKTPRYNSDSLILTDFIEVGSRFLGVLIFPVIFLLYASTLLRLHRKMRNLVNLSSISLLSNTIELSVFIIEYHFYDFLFKRKKTKRIFVVNRELCFPAIRACKKNGIMVYELQHGVTHGDTPLYSGSYCSFIDPDYFLVFGETWIGTQFGMPLDRIINVGWAYANFLRKFHREIEFFGKNSVLLISEPHITEKIIKVAVLLANKYNDYMFHIRLHPQEDLNQYQEGLFENLNNVDIQNNAVESSVAIQAYELILGENSSVLYEALSLGKKVGRFNIGGLTSDSIKGKPIDGFTYINSLEDFESFCAKNVVSESGGIYSCFDSDKIEKLK
ncbi:hypothetical protein BZG02_06235 [Labilibaculum filiforme]|uniref:Uncharacterized protein n=1 Tax=Labilibaculum filiforme TaxID=1940526 RepID=A0A2N3I269_9BACT|nr:hypothetical protein [Labilibaculum filiforme]PKQ64409.1 hypothetical protein BZG02_06235 [Labilibaculum filiforme]